MTAIEKAEELATRYLEDFDISTPEQRYEGLRWRVFQALTEDAAKMQERCAKVADRMALGYDDLKKYPHDEQEYVWQRAKYTAVGIAAAIRKVKP